MMKPFPVLVLLVSLATAGSAQNPFYLMPYPQLQSYLGLRDAQLTSILQNNADYSRFVADKQTRMSQVQLEIAQETAKSPLDPMALGIRYAEIETICRQIRDQLAAVLTKNRALLDQTQQTKLQALVDAANLIPIASEAQSVNLIAGGAAGASGSYADFLLGAGVTSSTIFSPFPGAITGVALPANRVANPFLNFMPAACSSPSISLGRLVLSSPAPLLSRSDTERR